MVKMSYNKYHKKTEVYYRKDGKKVFVGYYSDEVARHVANAVEKVMPNDFV